MGKLSIILIFLLNMSVAFSAGAGDQAPAVIQATEAENQAKLLIQECQVKAHEAGKTCNTETDPGMRQVQAMGMGMLQQMTMMAASNPQAACSGMGTLVNAANAALGAYQGYCGAKYMECSSACEENSKKINDLLKSTPSTDSKYAALQEAKVQIRDPYKRCNSLQQNLAGAAMNVMNLMMTAQSAAQCEKAASNPLTEFCKSNPQAPVCGQGGGDLAGTDCTNPETAANNTVCICRTNPADSRCGGFGGGGGSGGGNSGSSSASSFGSGGGAGGGSVDLGSDFGSPSFSPTGGSSANNEGQNRPGGGGGGGVGGGGRGGDTGSSAQPQGKGASGFNTKILSGFSGGGSGGGGGFGGGGGGGGSGSSYGGGGSGGVPGQAGVNLQQFMPGGANDPKRAIAGVVGPDGITGPNTNIFRKVNGRYFDLLSTEGFLP
ncbi:MAG: hypothetical protein ACK5P6_09870 [Pseudobdellovibrionaceae bacterium]